MTHSLRLWHRLKDRRIGRGSDGCRPSRRRREDLELEIPRAADLMNCSSGWERVLDVSRGVMYMSPSISVRDDCPVQPAMDQIEWVDDGLRDVQPVMYQ